MKTTIRVSTQLFATALCLGFSAGTVRGGGGLQFDGINDYVTFGQAPSLGVTNFTLECWFKRQATGQAVTTGTGGVNAIPLVTKGRDENEAGATNLNYFLGIGTNGVLVADFEDRRDGGNHPITGATAVASNVWQHAAVTYNQQSGIFTLYLNGQPDKTNTVTGNIATRTPRGDSIQPAALASALNSANVAAGFFGGTLDEVRVWNVARTADQISNSFKVQIPTATNLIARWALDETVEATASNSVPGGVNGTLVNGPVWTNGYTWTPSVTLTSPTNNATVSGPGVTMTATASAQGDASVTNVEFYASGARVAQDTTEPYSGVWTDAVPGSYTLWAVVADSVGARATSAVVNVTVVLPYLGGLSFDGTNDYVTFGAASGLGVSTFTIECWFKRTGSGRITSTGSGGVTNAIPLVTKGRGENEAGVTNMNFFLGFSPSGVLVADFEDTANGANHPVIGVTAAASNQWHHAAATYNGTSWALYLDGALETNVLIAGNPVPEYRSIQHAALGSAQTTTGAADGFFLGVLDEARVWNYARSASEITNSMRRQIASAPGLVARWGLNEDIGTIAYDSAGSWINGQLVNGPAWTMGYPFPAAASNTPPAIALLSPANGASFVAPANVSLSAAAADDGRVRQVEFRQGATSVGVVTNPPFRLVWSNVTVGSYALTAVARDELGLNATSSVVNINVQPGPPAVSITSPSNNAVVAASNLTITAVASPAAGGTITNVEFFGDGVKVGQDASAPYSTIWVGVSIGAHALRAVAWDNYGSRATSAVVNVSITPPVGIGGVYFDGVNDYATFGAAPALGVTNFTIECWFKRMGTGVSTTTGTGGVTNAIPLVTKGRGENEAGVTNMNFFLGLNPAGVVVADFEDTATGSNRPIVGVSATASNLWQHAAATYDGTSWALYLNGSLDATVTVPGNAVPEYRSIQHAALGSALTTVGAAAGFFSGALDEVRIWNYRRSAQQIGDNFYLQITNAPGLIARWALDDSVGTAVTNTGTSGVSGVLMNGPVWVEGYPWTGQPPNRLPNVTITSPTNGATLSVSALNIEATASDDDGTVAKVEFFANGAKVGEDTNSPYAVTWTDIPPGTHSLTAVATDDDGATRTSVAVTVAVLPAPGIGALYFDGVGDYVTFGAAPALGVTNFTIECWVKRLGAGATANTGNGGVFAVPLVTKGRGENEAGVTNMNFFLGIATNGALAADFEDTVIGGNHPVVGNLLLANNQWQHAAVTYNGTNWALYLNGTLDTTLTVTSNRTPEFRSIQHAALGSSLNTMGVPEGYWQGILDEVRIWNYARSATEIQGATNLQIVSAPGLIARWGLNEGVGASAADMSGTGVHGSLVNGPLWVDGYPFPPPGSNTPPVVVLISPSQGATYYAPASINVTASATDMDGLVTRVEFFQDSTSIGQVTNRPFGLVWSGVAVGDYTLRAVAVDSTGLMATSAVVNVSVIPSNHPPQIISLNFPANGMANVTNAPVLSVNVSDPEGSPLTVRFYGRSTVGSPGPDFTVVAIPDTQNYSSGANGGSSAIFQSQTDWAVSNRVSQNIVYVAHVGDVAETGDNSGNDVEWRVITNAMYRLENPVTTGLPDGIPYGLSVGNHDQSPNGSASGTTTFFNQYFGASHFGDHGYYGGHFGTNNDNHYDLFSGSGLDFIVLYLEYDLTATNATAPAYVWATNVLQTYASRRAIVVSHNIINGGANATFSTQGSALYNALKACTNICLMLCGHVPSPAEGQRQDTYAGHTIWTLMADYQSRSNGGSGWLRQYQFSPSNNVIRVRTYSPWVRQSETDADSQFDIAYNMRGVSGFMPFATNLNVASGGNAASLWSNLLAGTAHEWYVTVSDGTNTVTSPVWQFSTAGGTPPSVALTNPASGAVFESPANITLNATAGDPDNGVARVEFYQGDTKLGETFTAPYSIIWSGAGPGDYSLTAVAVDGGGLRTTSTPVPISVINISKTTNVLVPLGSVWKYLDNGSNLGTNWTQSGFNDSGWSSGPAELGYGDNDEATVLSYGPASTNKYVTTYFRHRFNVEEPARIGTLLISLLRDDGGVVYLNGVEIFRSNMPQGPITYTTLADEVIGGGEEEAFYSDAVVNTTLLVPGTNILAVEIHQGSVTSSDISFEMVLSGVVTDLGNVPPVTTNCAVNITGDQSTIITLIATDANGDPLTFAVDSLPQRGLLSDFNATNGTVIYTPAHGYRGLDNFLFHANDGESNSVPAALTLVVSAPTDVNANGLPDYWEATYGVTDPNADDDHDGASNLSEYQANTNPTDPASVLRIVTASVNGYGLCTFSWPSVGGTRYRISFSDDLGDLPVTFVDLVRPLSEEMDEGPIGWPAITSFTDDFTLTGYPSPTGSRYYRIQVVQ